MLEAISTGCVILASDTTPVTEVIRCSENGLLVDFFSAQGIVEHIEQVLDHTTEMAQIRAKARKIVLEHYALADLLPQHLQLIKDVAKRSVERLKNPKKSQNAIQHRKGAGR